MSVLTIVTRKHCPYCEEAEKNLAKILRENPALRQLPIRFLPEESTEHPEQDYYYVPAFFWDNDKLAEGEYTEESLRKILEQAYHRRKFG